MKLIYVAALATALSVPSLAKASVVDEGDVTLPNNFVDFLVTDENEPKFSYLTALTPTTFTIDIDEEVTQAPVLLVIDDFFGGDGGLGISDAVTTARSGTWLITEGENQANGSFSGFNGVVGASFLEFIDVRDLLFSFLKETGQGEFEVPALSLENGDTVTISTLQPMEFDASVLLSADGPRSYAATLFGASSEGAGPPVSLASTTVTFVGQAPTPVPLPAPALLLLCAVAALGVRRKA